LTLKVAPAQNGDPATADIVICEKATPVPTRKNKQKRGKTLAKDLENGLIGSKNGLNLQYYED
jgi:hypothetical protein